MVMVMTWGYHGSQVLNLWVSLAKVIPPQTSAIGAPSSPVTAFRECLGHESMRTMPDPVATY